MKHKVIILLVIVFIAVPGAIAQSHGPNQGLRLESAYQRLMLKADNSTTLEQQSGPTATAKEQHFWFKTEKFIDAWTALVTEYNEKGTFNMNQRLPRKHHCDSVHQNRYSQPGGNRAGPPQNGLWQLGAAPQLRLAAICQQ